MTNRECENRIRTALTHATPDRLESILSSCTEQSDPVVDVLHSQEERSTRMLKKRKERFAIAAFAAAAALMLCIGGYSLFRQGGGQVDSIILLDVNPSISLSVNEQEKVLAADALNEDAKEILGSMDLKGTSLEVAVNALIGSMLQKGYLGDMQNSILVSVENKDAVKGERLKQKVSAQIAEALRTDSMDGAVLSQTVNAEDTTLEALAQEYGISIGKAALIQEVIAQDSALAFDALAPMTINEIALIASSRNVTQGQSPIAQSGSASAQAYIGEKEALVKACEHAGVSVNDVYDQEVEFDIERGVMTYEVDFKAGTVEYEYDIGAITGEVIRFDREEKGIGGGNVGQNPGSGSGNGSGGSTEGSSGDSTGSSGTEDSSGSSMGSSSGNPGQGNESGAGSPATSYIGEDAAFAAALTHAGIADASTVDRKRIELDSEDGVMVYDVDFMVGTMEYDYEIDAVTGSVIWYDVENEGAPGNDAGRTNVEGNNTGGNNAGGNNAGGTNADSPSTTYIGEDAALSSALAHAGITDTSSLREVKKELDRDDGRVIYEVEFKVGNTEYEYEIDAYSGQVLKADSEIDD